MTKQVAAELTGRGGRTARAGAVSRILRVGAALLALEAMGALESLEAAPSFLGRTYIVDHIRHGRYQEAIKKQQKLYRKLIRE